MNGGRLGMVVVMKSKLKAADALLAVIPAGRAVEPTCERVDEGRARNCIFRRGQR